MAQFVVRNLESEVHTRLQAMAKQKGISTEEFARQVLRHAALEGEARPAEPLGTRLAHRFSRVGLKPGEQIRELKGQNAQSAKLDQ
jgi:plasmid stability protein